VGDVSGNNFICNSTKSPSSMTTGSLIVKGRAGIAQNLNVGRNSNITGVLTTNDLTNNTSPLIYNSSLSQIGASTFSSLITSNNGITNSTGAITNNSKLSQVGTSTFRGSITSNGGLTTNGSNHKQQQIESSGDINI